MYLPNEQENLAGPVPSLLWLFLSDLVFPLSFLHCLAPPSATVSPFVCLSASRSLTISHLPSCCATTSPHCHPR